MKCDKCGSTVTKTGSKVDTETNGILYIYDCDNPDCDQQPTAPKADCDMTQNERWQLYKQTGEWIN